MFRSSQIPLKAWRKRPSFLQVAKKTRQVPVVARSSRCTRRSQATSSITTYSYGSNAWRGATLIYHSYYSRRQPNNCGKASRGGAHLRRSTPRLLSMKFFLNQRRDILRFRNFYMQSSSNQGSYDTILMNSRSQSSRIFHLEIFYTIET